MAEPRLGDKGIDQATGKPVWYDGVGWSYTEPKGPEGWTESGRPGDVHTVSGALGNTIGSFGRLLGETAGAIVHPIETVKGLASLVTSPEARGAVVDLYKQRYGGLENIADTLYHDPAGVAADASVALRGLGLGAKVAGLRQAGTLGRAGNLIDPIQMSTGPIASATAGLGRAVEGKAPALMRSALKVRPTLEKKNANVNFAEEALKRGTVAGEESGLQKIAGDISQKETEIDRLISGSTASRPPREILKRGQLRAWKAERAKTKGVDPKGLEAAKEVERDFLSDPTYARVRTVNQTVAQPSPILGPNGQPVMTPQTISRQITSPGALDMPIQEIQRSKVRLGNNLENAFGKDVPGPVVEAQQKLRVDLKDNVADLEPGIAPVNAELGPMYALQEALGDRMATFSRQNILPMRAGIGSWIMGANPNNFRHVIGAIGGMAVDDPRVLSRAAIQARPFGQSLQQGAQRVRAFSSGLTPLAEAGQVTEEAMRAALLSQLNGSTEKP